MAQHRIRSMASLVASVALAAALFQPAAAAAPVTRWVDDDGHAGVAGCNAPHASFTQVQAAIDASGVNDIVVVCPGVYHENLSLDSSSLDGLVLKGATPGTAFIRAPATGGPTPLLDIAGADGVSVSALVLQSPTSPPCRRLLTVIRVFGSTGVSLSGDRIEPLGTNTIGKCGFDDGIDIMAGASATVDHVSVRDFRLFGIFVDGTGTSGVVRHSTISFLHIHESGGSLASAQTVGLYGRDSADVVFRGNTVTGRTSGGHATPLFDLGIKIYNFMADPVITGNTVRYAQGGINVTTVGGIIKGNTLQHGRHPVNSTSVGLGLSGGDSIEVSGNTVSDFGTGILVDGGASGHDIHDNDFRGNHTRDCDDQTTGSGSQGTDNTWTHDFGTTAHPTGICKLP